MSNEQLLLSHRFRVYFAMQPPGVKYEAGSAVSKLAWLSRLSVRGSSFDMGFERVSGVSRQLSVTPLVQGGENVRAVHLPDRVSNSPLVLARGVMLKAPSLDLLGMRHMFEQSFDRFQHSYADMEIVLMDARDRPVLKWDVTDAMATRWQFGDLEAGGNTVLIETLELTYRSIRIAQVPR